MSRIAIGYPPLNDPRGHHQTGQNRQAQVFAHGAYIFPVVMASAATMLKEAGHEVLWADGEAEEQTWDEYRTALLSFRPDVIAFEVKTPSVKRTWQRVNQLSKDLPDCHFVLCGDHVTALPQETLDNCRAHTVITGGDYDFALRDICENPARKRGIYNKPTDTPLSSLPLVDRELTKWSLYAYEKGSGNYKYLPGTHSYFGRDCWWRKDGGCTFCSWTNTFKNFRVVPVGRAVEEVVQCHKLGIREIFDDTGTFPVGKWLEEFCEEIIKLREKGVLGKKFPVLGCNMRPGALHQREYDLLGRAGFRFILYGLESASQNTLDRINKGQKPGDMVSTLQMAKNAGLEPHATCMVGYPWETLEDARRTIDFTRDLFRKGLIDTLQATIVIPYPGTALFRQAKENGWLLTEDWDRYDMREPILKCDGKEHEIRELAQGIYKSCITPSFIARKVLSIRNMDDVKFMWKAAKFMGGHLKDFATKQPAAHY